MGLAYPLDVLLGMSEWCPVLTTAHTFHAESAGKEHGVHRFSVKLTRGQSLGCKVGFMGEQLCKD